MKYTLKRNFWNSKIELFRNDTLIGRIENLGVWGFHSKGTFMNKNYTFMNKGTFSNRVEVLDDNKTLLGAIHYPFLSSKANIEVNGKKFFWTPIGFWGSRWKLFDDNGREIFLEKKEFSANFPTEEKHEFLLFLSSFLLFNYYKRLHAAGAA